MLRLLGAGTVLLVTTAASLAAEPITLNYQIVVNQRLDYTLPPSMWQWSAIGPIAFPLSMTFDSQVTRTVETPTSAIVFFGPPHFTAVPLAGAGLPAQRPYGGSYIVNFGFEQGAYADGFLLTTESDYAASQRGPRLFADLNHTLPPSALGDVGTFVAAMRSTGVRFEFYDYAFAWRDGAGGRLPQPIYAPNSAGYTGPAEFVSMSSPVPEPSTLLLIGSALLGVAARRRFLS